MARTIASKRQGVDGETEQVHQAEGADQRDRDGDQRDQGRAKAAQKDEDYQDDQDDRFADGLKDIGDRPVDKDGTVISDRDLHPFGEAGFDLGDDGPDLPGDIEGVGGPLANDAEGDGRLSLETDHRPLVLGPEFGAADILEPDHVAAGILEDHIVELKRCAQVGFGQDSEFAFGRLDAS